MNASRAILGPWSCPSISFLCFLVSLFSCVSCAPICLSLPAPVQSILLPATSPSPLLYINPGPTPNRCLPSSGHTFQASLNEFWKLFLVPFQPAHTIHPRPSALCLHQPSCLSTSPHSCNSAINLPYFIITSVSVFCSWVHLVNNITSKWMSHSSNASQHVQQ